MHQNDVTRNNSVLQPDLFEVTLLLCKNNDLLRLFKPMLYCLN